MVRTRRRVRFLGTRFLTPEFAVPPTMPGGLQRSGWKRHILSSKHHHFSTNLDGSMREDESATDLQKFICTSAQLCAVPGLQQRQEQAVSCALSA